MDTAVAADRSEELSEAFRSHRAALVGFARRRLFGSAMLAEEAVQETFLRAWRSIDRFDPDAGSLRMWLFAICRNATADVARRRARHARADHIESAERGADGADVAALEQLSARWQVHEALRVLPAWQREAIVAVHLRERPYAEVAAELGVPVGTVKSRVHLGLRAARQALVRAPCAPTAECA
ncbi:MAG: RNA polymerase sigma factor [Acidimicrobiales bacterium]